MNLDDYQQYIITDVNEFWTNSVDPKNISPIFRKLNVSTVKGLIKLLTRPENKDFLIINNLFRNYYLVKGEYLVCGVGTTLLTNKRLYILNNQELSIPISLMTFYGTENGVYVIKYQGEMGEKKYFPVGVILSVAIVNNHIERYKYSPDLNNEVIQQLIFKSKTSFETEETRPVQVEFKEYKQRKNYSKLITVCIILLFIGGCTYYLATKDDSTTSNAITNTNPAYDSITGKKKKICPWCGGIGRVGYAGESKAQFERTGMGLGNPCIKCNGTGYVSNDDSDK